METENDIILYGTFKQEIKNRFLCSVLIDGQEELCYIPSSCRLSNFLDLTNKLVLLKPTTSKNTRTKYSVYAVKAKGQYILLNLSQPNKIIRDHLHRRYFSYLGSRKTIKTEITIEGYKSDLFIEDTKTIIEIKSLLCYDRSALFPTVYSERAIEQLYKLSSLLSKGYKVCYIFISLNPMVKSIMINEGMSEYKEVFTKCIQQGMQYDAFTVRLNDQYKPELKKRIKFDS